MLERCFQRTLTITNRSDPTWIFIQEVALPVALYEQEQSDSSQQRTNSLLLSLSLEG